MKNYIDEDLYDIELGTTSKLYAINIREGDTKDSGLCYCYVKIKNDWILFNDNYTNFKNPNYCLGTVVGLY